MLADRTQPDPAEPDSLAKRALRENPLWYHTLELAPGLLTPGQVDLRDTAGKILPAQLEGKRALDVGTFDGFWAFELERRGADVVALDLPELEQTEWPPVHREHYRQYFREVGLDLGRGFRLAAEALRSRARRVACDVYDLTSQAVDGPVDVAFVGALLLHLRDPVGALERVYEVLEPGGEIYLLEVVSLRDTLLAPRVPKARFDALETPFNWWRPNLSALRCWLRTAGFVNLRHLGFHHPPQRKPMNEWFVGAAASRPAG